MKAPKSPLQLDPTNVEEMDRKLAAAAIRMGQQVREHHRRWGIPLVIEKDGKVIKIPA